MDELAERIHALSPSQLVVSRYFAISLSDLPSPNLVVCADRRLALVSGESSNRVRLLDEAGNASAPLSVTDFDGEYEPELVISYVGGYGASGGNGRRVVPEFLKFNLSRLARGFVGNLLSSVLAIALPIGALLIIDKVLAQNGVGTLDVILLFVLLAELSRFLLAVSRDKVLQTLGNDFEHESTNLLFHCLLWHRPGSRSGACHDAHLLARASSDLGLSIQKHTASIASDLVFLLFLMILLFSLSVTMGRLALAGVIIVLLVTLVHARLRSRVHGGHTVAEDARNERLSECLRKVDDFAIMGRESYLWDAWRRSAADLSGYRRNGKLFVAEAEPLGNFLQSVLRAALLWFGAQEVLEQNLSLGQFIAFSLLAMLALGPVRKVGGADRASRSAEEGASTRAGSARRPP